MSKKNPLVSVIMLTYGHEEFIEEALNGVLNQHCEFEVELIIANDKSPDGTSKVVERVQRTHPNGSWVKHHEHSVNKGIQWNFIWATEQVKGKYVALCEGDDFWVDNKKLQKQVNFLENNDSYSGVFNPARQIYECSGKERTRNIYKNYNESEFSFEKILFLGGGFYPTASFLFKADVLKGNPSDIWMHSTGDYPLALLVANHGKIGYIDEVMTVYRVQNQSVTNFLYPSITDCNEAVKKKHKTNTAYISILKERFSLKANVAEALFKKENYILLSKYIDCGCFKCALKGIFRYKLGLTWIFRLIAKCIYIYVSTKGNGVKVSQ